MITKSAIKKIANQTDCNVPRNNHMKKLYILSAPLDGKPRRLIGELTEDNGKYSFKYRFAANKFSI
jgi:hypothetical protein